MPFNWTGSAACPVATGTGWTVRASLVSSAAGTIAAAVFSMAPTGCVRRADRGAKVAPLDIRLPRPGLVCCDPRDYAKLHKRLIGTPRPPFMAPVGARNVALGKPVTASDEDPIIGEIEQVTDGDKEADDGSYIELGPGRQYVQIDLEAEHRICAVVFWLGHSQVNDEQRSCRDVVLQLAEDAEFSTNVRTVFNNDHDNSSGLGAGKNPEYAETYEGKLVDTGGASARYVRLYCSGNTDEDMNRYTEVEAYGVPAE